MRCHMSPVWLLAAVLLAVTGCGEERPETSIGAGVEVEENAPSETALNYELTDTFAPELERLRAVEVTPSGRVYVAGGQEIAVLGRDGSVERRWRAEGPVGCLAVDEDGTVYAGLESRVVAYGPDGTAQAGWGTPGDGRGELEYVTDLALKDGYIYVADSGQCVIHRYTVGGDFVEDIGRREGSRGGGLVCPSLSLECEVDEDGQLYVANIGRLRIERYDRNARLKDFWGSFGAEPENFIGCCNPVSICLMPQNRLATAEKGIPRVKIYDRGGGMLDYLESDLFAAETSDLDLAAGPEGALYVADPGDGTIKIFTQPQ